VLYFSFMEQGGRELRGREKEKKKKEGKKVVDLGLSDPAPSCSQPVIRQTGWQQLFDTLPGCYAL
jgi:hypothetical protein